MEKDSRLDQALAKVCLNCPLCRRARQRQRGLTFRLVQKIESRVCPFCRAYKVVFGHKAHERRAYLPPTSFAFPSEVSSHRPKGKK
jgi:hypothetical protein